MLHTLKEGLLPTVRNWLDWLMQCLGFFSFTIAHQANTLIQSIHDNLSQGWLSPTEHTQILQEQEGWQAMLESIDTKKKPPNLRLLFTLEKKTNGLL